MIAEQVNDDGTVYFRVFVKPLVNLIWLAGLVFLLGSRRRALAGRARGAPAGASRYDEAGAALARPMSSRSSSARCSPSLCVVAGRAARSCASLRPARRLAGRARRARRGVLELVGGA